MATATLTRPATSAATPSADDAPTANQTPRRPAVNPDQPAARGFALYVGFDAEASQLDGVSLTELARALREVIAERAPHAATHASVAFAPHDAPGASLDLVRLALQEPRAIAEQRAARQQQEQEEAEQRSRARVIIDTSRKRVSVDGDSADFTYKEFELLQALVLREGRTVTRDEIVEVLWPATGEERPHERTIDVHVRRLRSKLGDFADIVRTVRGGGYRFDRHADVRVVHASGPSPDR